jgi:hypothetical protein
MAFTAGGIMATVIMICSKVALFTFWLSKPTWFCPGSEERTMGNF